MNRKANRGLVLGLLLATELAAAEPPSIRARGTLPFTVEELEQALLLRAAPAETEAMVVSVTGEHDGIRIAVAGRERLLAFDTEDSEEAARLVAFAILDLTGAEIEPPPARSRTVAVADRAVDVEVAAPAAVDTRRREPTWAVALWAATGSRQEVVLEIDAPVRRSLRVTLSTGASRIESTTRSERTVDLRSFPVRAGLTWRGPRGRAGGLEAGVSAIGLVQSAAAARRHTAAVFGAGLAIRWAIPVAGSSTRRIRVLAGAGIDGFATGRDYRIDGVPITTTERLPWWAGVGIAGELWR